MTAKSSPRGSARITLIAIHTNEGPNPADVFPDRTAENLARWMEGEQVSYHKIVDDDSVVNFVPDNRYAWALRAGNSRSLNLCFTGYSRFSREEWLSHRNMLQRAATEVKQWCDRYGIPKLKLNSNDVFINKSGIIGHANWTEGKHDGNHTDPGDGFPFDIFIQMVGGKVNDPQLPGIPLFPLPRNEYFGLISGPKQSHGGYYEHERLHIRAIQQRLIIKKYVPGVSDSNSGWADGLYEQPTFDAVIRFQRTEMPHTTRFGEVWWDDWEALFR